MSDMRALYRKSMKARELPADWQKQAQLAPDDEVIVVITPAPEEKVASPKRFIGAGKGLFRSAREVDAYIRRNREAWQS